MEYYNSKLAEFESLKQRIPQMHNEELKKCLHELCGIALIELQKNEFIVHGIVSHFKEDLLKKDKNFKNLTPRSFLDDDIQAKKSRKQTLGLILNFLLNATDDVFDDEEINNYLAIRNRFIHNFWRDFLSNKKLIQGKRNAQIKSIDFVVGLLKENLKWEIIFKGLMFSINTFLEKKHNKKLGKVDHLEVYHNDFIQYAMRSKEKAKSKLRRI